MNWYALIMILLSAIVSLFAVNWIYFKILKIAKEKNLVDNPDARKLQKNPVPVVGGLAVFFGVIMGALAGAAFFGFFGNTTIIGNDITSIARMLPLILGMSIMLYVGCMDDILGLSPKARFLIEKGLSSGLCITCCMLFGIMFYGSKDYINSVLAFSMAASLLPFFIHNVFGNTSRMFIGDAGTMVMGILMTWFVMCAMHDGAHFDIKGVSVCPTAMVVAILSVPIADTLRVMTMRVMRGKSPFNPDKTHLHHAFVAIGVSHSITALSEILINLFVVGMWYTITLLGAPLQCQLYSVVLIAAILVWGTYFFLDHENTSNSRKAEWLRNFSVKTHLGNTEWWQRFSYKLDSPEYNEHELKNLRKRLERKFSNYKKD